MIPITKPVLFKEEANAARKAVLSGWVTQGPKVAEFETKFAAAVGASHACAVSSCTAALHISLLALGVKPGNVVITVSHSFIATANVVRHCGAEPIFIDVDPTTYNMDPGRLKEIFDKECYTKEGQLYFKRVRDFSTGESPLVRFSRNIKGDISQYGRVAAIMPVHQMGFPCSIHDIVMIAREHGLPVIEDAACAIGSEVSFNNGSTWEKIGKPHGDIACFSFHPRKVLTTGDGGMITSNSVEVDDRIRLLRQHGMSISDTVRHGSNTIIFENYVTTGFNYRLTDIQAAVGIEQLNRLDHIVDERRKLAAAYGEALKENLALEPISPDSSIRPNWQSYPVKLAKDSSLDQETVMQRLLDHGVATRRGIMNAHEESPYKCTKYRLPHSEDCKYRTILLPLFPGLTSQEIRFIRDELYKILSS